MHHWGQKERAGKQQFTHALTGYFKEKTKNPRQQLWEKNCKAGTKNTKKKSRWRQVCAQSRKQNPSLPAPPSQGDSVQGIHRYEALDVEDLSEGCNNPLSLDMIPRLLHWGRGDGYWLGRRWVGDGLGDDSSLQGTERPIHREDPLLKEVHCLPGAWVRDVTVKLPNLVWPTDDNPLLLFHTGRHKEATW